mmetsp:Transcript_74755/g.132045  ORF Transcript_74755/g.132045 Transcript_74755/m.132045 type:complete len:252 (-) Transcript_74755:391-1146(-)
MPSLVLLGCQNFFSLVCQRECLLSCCTGHITCLEHGIRVHSSSITLAEGLVAVDGAIHKQPFTIFAPPENRRFRAGQKIPTLCGPPGDLASGPLELCNKTVPEAELQADLALCKFICVLLVGALLFFNNRHILKKQIGARKVDVILQLCRGLVNLGHVHWVSCIVHEILLFVDECTVTCPEQGLDRLRVLLALVEGLAALLVGQPRLASAGVGALVHLDRLLLLWGVGLLAEPCSHDPLGFRDGVGTAPSD